MDQQTFIRLGVGAGVVIGLAISRVRLSRQNTALAPRVLDALTRHGALTLGELAATLGMSSFMARGKVVLALGELQQSGAVAVIDAPPGTPQLKKVDFIRYRLNGTDTAG